MARQGIIVGVGQVGFTNKAGVREFWRTRPMKIELAPENTDVQAKAFEDGKIITTGVALLESNWTAKLMVQDVGFRELVFGLGMKAALSQNIEVEGTKSAVIDGAGEVVDAELVVGVPPAFTSVGKVFVTAPSDEVAYQAITAGAPTATQFKVEAGKLVFNASQAGKRVAYQITSQIAGPIGTIGFEQTVSRLGAIAFNGILKGNAGTDHSRLIIPEMVAIKEPTITVGDTPTEMELEYRLIQTEESVGIPFKLVKLH